MSKMPEQIWALLEPEWEDGDGEQFVGGTWDAGRFKEGAQYTRADTAAAQVAAAYERGAREALSRMLPNFDEDSRAKIIEAAYRNYKQMRQGASGQIITEWDGIESHVVEATRAAILALLDNPTHTPDPDEPTEADQDLAFRKAVSS